MKTVQFYHKETGYLRSVVVSASDESGIVANTPPDHVAIVHPTGGMFDHMSERIDVVTGEALPYRPPAPSDDHEWHETTKRWRIKQHVVERNEKRTAIRQQIAELLSSATEHLIAHAIGVPSALEELKKTYVQIETLKAQDNFGVKEIERSGGVEHKLVNDN